MTDKEKAMEKRYKSTTEIAKHFGVSQSTIWNMACHGKINGIKIGNRRYFILEEVEKAFAEAYANSVIEYLDKKDQYLNKLKEK